MCSLYLGENLISGSKPINLGVRNIGEIVPSILPLTDAGLHLLDGTLISGDGIYKGFVDYIAELYAESSKKSNVTKVGSLTDNNGVLSNFSTSNYAKFPNNFQPGSNPWEIVFKIKTRDITTGAQYIVALGKGLTSETRYATRIYIHEDHFRITVSYNGTAWDIPEEDATGTYTVQSNTDYYVKFQYTGSAYILSYSLDGETYIEDINKTSSTPIYNANTACLIGIWSNGSYTSPWLGSIDLKESYININGSRWWTGANPSWTVDETAWQSSVSTYGSCGKFVYNATDNTVRLPKITGIIEGTTDLAALGDLIEAGLPNITGTSQEMIFRNGNYNSRSGCLNYQRIGTFWDSNSGSTYQGDRFQLNFDASRSSSIYGNSTTVQPQTIKAFVYIVVANSTKTEIEVDIDNVVTDLNNKADTDLTNTTNTGKVLMSSMGMPSNKYINLTLNASGSSYTAPANGWFVLEKVAGTDDTYAFFKNSRNGMTTGDVCNSSWQTMQMYIPVKKGDVIYLQYTITGNTNAFRFIYAQGSESEAQ